MVVNIADARISGDADDVLVTYSLGSCIGIAIYDPVVGVGGVLHSMLPVSRVEPDKAIQQPFMFVDTGLTRFLDMLFQRGVRRMHALVKVAGCARVLDSRNVFRIGERNYAVLRRILWKNGMMITAEAVGGDAARTLRLEIASGRCRIRSNGTEREL